MIMPQQIEPMKPRASDRKTTMHRGPMIWGLDARALHEAYWRSRGVQVIECGRDALIDRDAELYMLVEPDCLAEFDLPTVTERMTWNGAAVMRLRLSSPGDDHYAERIQLAGSAPPTDANLQSSIAPRIERIQRLYRTARPDSHRLILTRSREHAEVWCRESNRRAAWMRIRRSLPYYRVVHWRCAGLLLDAASPDSAGRYLHRLVRNWTDPDSSIEGIQEIAPQVWALKECRLGPESLVIGPVWLGAGHRADSSVLLVGPDYEPDAPVAEHQPRASVNVSERVTSTGDASAVSTGYVRVRPIGEVEPGNRQSEADDRDESDDVGRSTNEPIAALSPLFLISKRLFDIAVSTAVLLAVLPLLLGLALAVVISDGRPIFYGHLRQSRGGRLFRCWKFRTMRRDADRMTRELQSLNRCDGPQFYIVDDPRVTRIGRFMRRYHLDELPQFWNVLIGDMSIVGPRPSPDSENQYCPPWRETRLSVRPGITGLWQVERTRAPGLDFQEWIRFDTEYVRNAGFLLDCRILLKTIQRLFSQRHAPQASRPSSEQLVASAGSAGDPTHPASG